MPRAVVSIAIVIAVLLAQRAFMEPGGRIVPASTLTPYQQSAGLSFGPEVTAGDRQWILAAIASARPEARRLIDVIDGRVTIRTHTGSPLRLPRSGRLAMGYADSGPRRSEIVIYADPFNGQYRNYRSTVVLHELGHVVDYVLVSDELGARLDIQIPRGDCDTTSDRVFGTCSGQEERFAETFAKWALRGAVSSVGGYAIPSPPSLEEWGAPLVGLAEPAR